MERFILGRKRVSSYLDRCNRGATPSGHLQFQIRGNDWDAEGFFSPACVVGAFPIAISGESRYAVNQQIIQLVSILTTPQAARGGHACEVQRFCYVW
jgi:hypothetical protein